MTQDVVSISLEPASSQGLLRPVSRYEEDIGRPIYKEKPPATAKFDRAVTELLLLKPGRFSEIKADNVHLIKSDGEKEAEEVEENSKEDDKVDEDVANDQKRRKELSAEEMGMMKYEVAGRLHAAWQQMMKTSEIIRSLTPLQPHPYTEPHLVGNATIPADSLMTTSSLSDKPPSKDIFAALDVKKMILARNRKGLSDAKEALVVRAGEMRRQMAGEPQYWTDLKSLAGFPIPADDTPTGMQMNAIAGPSDPRTDISNGNKVWSIRPRWKPGRDLDARVQMASDVMIPYAPDEAGLPFRMAAIATLDPPASPVGDQKEEVQGSSTGSRTTIRIPARRRRRLRLCIRTADQRDDRVSFSTLDDSALEEDNGEGADSNRSLERAAEELFEEEIYNEIRTEAKASPTLNARISVDSVTISAVPEQELVFELVNLDELEDGEDVPKRSSAKADLILSIVKMSMLKIYRERSAPKAVEPEPATEEISGPSRPKAGTRSKPGQPPSAAVKPVQPPSAKATVFGTLVPYLHYQAFLGRLLQVLGEFRKTIGSFGLDFGIRRKDSGVVGGLDWASLVGGTDGYKDGSIDVTLEGRQIVSLTISSSATFTLVFPNVYLPSSDMTQLPSYVSRELRQCLVDVIEEHVRSKTEPSGFAKVAKDHLAGTVSTAKTRIVVDIGATLPVSSIKAYILRRKGDRDTHGQETTIQHIEEVVFDGTKSDEGELLRWVNRMIVQ
ncbi:hypothetical protein FFLO_05589 [Filobasidium floriforme]|uniref:Mediator of RNA polymerase II transcription subunit 17 n=1 Tax=Filobasidium floriforme TaxID=5210 RepID=A0A8K0JH17_9TREE|nr:hypothetical protein FFLO_05589 [Filobasidium floriforme]